MTTKLIYIAGGDVSVLESQVLELLKFYHTQELPLALIMGHRNTKEKIEIEKKLSKYPFLDVIWFKSYPTYQIFESAISRNVFQAVRKVKDWKNSFLHVRSEYLGYIVKRMVISRRLSNRVLIDIRGIVYKEIEYKYTRSLGIRRFLLKIQSGYYKSLYNRLFDNRIDSQIMISSVSKPINEYIRENYPDCNYKLCVHPNIAGEIMKFSVSDRYKIRKEYGIKDNDLLAVCLSGGDSLWQQDKKNIDDLIKKGIRVISLSKKAFNNKKCISLFVPFQDVSKYLSAADIGILWRDRTFINYTASPSKLSEFAASGLFIINNGSVNIAEEYIEQSGAGLIIDNMCNLNSKQIEQVKQQDRLKNERSGKKMFGVDAIGNSYINLYRTD